MLTPATNPDNNPTISLGGVDYPVPKLALAQNRKLQPIFARLAPRMMSGVDMADLGEQETNDLIDVVALALSRAHVGVTKADLDELPISVIDLARSFLTVMEQSGLFKRAEPKPGEDKGEASPQTGIVSSPDSPAV